MPLARSETYPPKVTEFARRLYADGNGKSISEIRAALEKRGFTPSRDTILYWVDENYKEEKLHRQRTYRPPGPPPRRGWRLRFDRMAELREIGLSYTAIATLMSHDFKIEINESQVRSILQRKVTTRTIRNVLWPKEATA